MVHTRCNYIYLSQNRKVRKNLERASIRDNVRMSISQWTLGVLVWFWICKPPQRCCLGEREAGVTNISTILFGGMSLKQRLGNYYPTMQVR